MPVVSSSPVTCLKILPYPYLSNHRPYALQVRASCMTLRYPIKPCEKADFFSFTWKVVFYFWDDIYANLKKKKKDIVFSDALCFEHLEKDESDFFKGS